MAITKQQMLDKLAEQKTSVESALSTLITDNDSITNNIEASLGNHLMFLAVTEPLIKKYVEDNY
tara:strand:+ start:6703 stop:6894 length:192 start_codon:yes stop_codon:yes gene_type:complete